MYPSLQVTGISPTKIWSWEKNCIIISIQNFMTNLFFSSNRVSFHSVSPFKAIENLHWIFYRDKRRSRVRGELIWCEKWICLEILHRYSNSVFFSSLRERDKRYLHARVHRLCTVLKNVATWHCSQAFRIGLELTRGDKWLLQIAQLILQLQLSMAKMKTAEWMDWELNWNILLGVPCSSQFICGEEQLR